MIDYVSLPYPFASDIWVMPKATAPSLFLRFVLIFQYYVLENIPVLISKKCPYL